jgi:ribosomal protein L37AE/L43A
MRPTTLDRQPPEDDPTCPACGARLRFRGRRGRVDIWSCDRCGLLSEIFDPAAASPPKDGRRDR